MRRIIVVWIGIMMLMGGMIGIVNLSTDAEADDGDAENSASKSEPTAHDPIYIDGNDDFIVGQNGVVSGSGTEGNPYIIGNWDINASNANGIDIRNTDKYFIIRNCVIHDGKDNNYRGVYFYKVTNGKIDMVTSYNNYGGIILGSSSNNNQITDCNVYNDSAAGLLLSSSNNTITNCNVYNNPYYGISLNYASNNQITNCNVYNNKKGIYLLGSSDNQITNCDIYNNSQYGIDLDYSSNNNAITNCDIYNTKYGINLLYSSNNKVRYSNIYNNTHYGIYNYNTELEYAITVTYCWWGSSDGPYHPDTNPTGTGDKVTENVLYDPWLTEPVEEGAGAEPEKKKEKGFIPAFEVATFLIAIVGVCIILLRKRKVL
ncbi:MAG: right-handed parallel beta-helix repeat-containing protein [Thermoplasmatales archaeon]|nr:right-handed parallel beta-helix repeat-containing protein [Thermoplasmatales archaeon]